MQSKTGANAKASFVFERDLLFSNSESDKLHGALLCPSVNFKGSLNCELHLALKIMDV